MAWYVMPFEPFDWLELETRGRMLSSTSGQGESKGRTTVDLHDSAGAAERALLERAQQLVAAGYLECRTSKEFETQLTKVSSVSWRKAWSRVAQSKHLDRAFVKHFSYLASTAGDRERLERIAKRVRATDLVDKQLLFTFAGGEQLRCDAPSAAAFPDHPACFRALMQRHECLSFPNEDGIRLRYEGPAEAKPVLGGAAKAWCMADISDAWFFHPEEKNPSGEPVVCFWSHESGDFQPLPNRSLGTLFLEQLEERFS